MVYILVQHTIKDYEQFRKVFFENLALVKNNGSQGGYIFKNKDNPNEVFVLVQWRSIESFQKFAEQGPKDAPQRATVVGEPKGWFFEEVEKF